MKIFLWFFAPGAKLPEGANQITFGYEGLSWGWAFFLFVALAAAVIWSYKKYGTEAPALRRTWMVFFRLSLIAVFLLLLVQPVLNVAVAESVRRKLLVLLDVSQSMDIQDRRDKPDDLARAAIAKGLLDPVGGLSQPVPADASLAHMSRADILRALAENPRLNFWQKLHEKAELEVYGFGRDATSLGALAPPDPDAKELPPGLPKEFFTKVTYNENLTAIGDAVRKLLDETRGQSTAGILLITDGANNMGALPQSAAAAAAQDGVPLYAYGIGVTSPQDIIAMELVGPRAAYQKEKCTVTLRAKSQNLTGRSTKAILKAGGKEVDSKPVAIREDGEFEVELTFTPDKVGSVNLEATIVPLDEESVKDNNTVRLGFRVVDNKYKVLFIEQAPRWEFQFLFSFLQRDRRTDTKCVVIDGDRGLGVEDAPPTGEEKETPKESPYLDAIPEDEKTLKAYDLIVIGDVNPEQIGETRMKIIAEWVSKQSGGLIFISGPRFNPSKFKGTPLEPLYPVELSQTEGETEYYPEPLQMKLTPAGEISSITQLSERAEENQTIWKNFPGIRWTARVGRAKPGAQVFLSDPTPERSNRDGQMPVMAMMNYGLGQIIYVGFQETYRWRSRAGEKFYGRIWAQMMQGLSDPRTGGNQLAHLKADRPRYLVGERVVLTGKIMSAPGEPLRDSSTSGVAEMEAEAGKEVPPGSRSEFRMIALPDKPGEFRGEFIARAPGNYNVNVAGQKASAFKFEVVEPRFEQADTAMNLALLTKMTAVTGGKVFREETLHEMPSFIASKSESLPVYKKIALYHSPWLALILVLLACGEWLLRRLSQLK